MAATSGDETRVKKTENMHQWAGWYDACCSIRRITPTEVKWTEPFLFVYSKTASNWSLTIRRRITRKVFDHLTVLQESLGALKNQFHSKSAQWQHTRTHTHTARKPLDTEATTPEQDVLKPAASRIIDLPVRARTMCASPLCICVCVWRFGPVRSPGACRSCVRRATWIWGTVESVCPHHRLRPLWIKLSRRWSVFVYQGGCG